MRVSKKLVQSLAGGKMSADPNRVIHALANDLINAWKRIEDLQAEGGGMLLDMSDADFEELLQSMREARGIARARVAGGGGDE